MPSSKLEARFLDEVFELKNAAIEPFFHERLQQIQLVREQGVLVQFGQELDLIKGRQVKVFGEMDSVVVALYRWVLFFLFEQVRQATVLRGDLRSEGVWKS